VARFIESNFIAVRVHVREQAPDFKRLGERYGVQWTPAILVIDPDGVVQHRIEGFLPADDLLAQLMLGLGHGAFHRQEWPEAVRWFTEVLDQQAESDAAAEAEYWAGVSHYKVTGDAGFLAHTAEVFGQRFQNTPWAKKASVWARPAA
jgi:Thioredoxin-like domain